MQLRLPLYPKETTFVSDILGVYEQAGIVQYILNGVPAYCHKMHDNNSFWFITSNYIALGHCRKSDVERCFGVSPESVRNWHKKFVEEGPVAFFGEDARKGGKSHKITGERLERIQQKLDKGRSNNSIAKEEGVRESAIRYALKQGYLKKSLGLRVL
jgi:predicted transcriptional regulator